MYLLMKTSFKSLHSLIHTNTELELIVKFKHRVVDYGMFVCLKCKYLYVNLDLILTKAVQSPGKLNAYTRQLPNKQRHAFPKEI